MAEITGQQGASLTNELAQCLQNADGLVSSEELAGIINEYPLQWLHAYSLTKMNNPLHF